MAPRYAIYDSSDDSESGDGPKKSPSDGQLEKGLRDTVANVLRVGNLEELTVKRVRLATAKALGIDEGFFKRDEQWKTKSDQIIKDEAEVQMNGPGKSEDKQPSRPQKQSKLSKPSKRESTEESSKPKKRRKIQAISDSKEEASVPPSPAAGLNSKVMPKKQTKGEIVSDESDNAGENGDHHNSEQPAAAEKGASDSEMSVVLDEEPKPKKKRQKSAEAEPKKGKSKTTSKPDADLDPDQAEIKRLQGWLVKCGIRKMWFRELAPYDTSKAKVKHLKTMLDDAGMKGRYSLEKARQIRVERELRADLEIVQEGARRWGTGSGDEESDNEGKPRRRLARGLKNLAFLGDDGEETD